MSSERYSTRRKVLAASGSATLLGLAGCVGGNGETDDATGTDDTETDDTGDDTGIDENGGTEQTVTLLVEGVGGYGHEEEAVSQFDVIDRDTDEVTAYVHGDHWDGSFPHIDEDEHISLGAYIEDGHGDEVELDGDHYELRVKLAEGATEDVVSFDYHGDHLHIIGDHHGETVVVFQLYHDDHVEYETPPITVEVEDHDDDGHDDDDDDDGHAHDDDHDDHHYDEDGLTEDEIDHACGHMDFDEGEPLEGGETEDDAPTIHATHQPYDVTFTGDVAYVKFEADDDDHDDHGGEMFGFFTEHGSADAVKGHVIYTETEEVEHCGPMDRYVIVEPDHGEVIVELTAL